MREKVLLYIRERRLVCAGDRVAVAVSGGADSVALLRALLELRAELGIVLATTHFNHGLRGEESNADEAFVADLAKHHRLEFFAGRGDVRAHALTSKLGIEATGRELRYRWFSWLAADQRLDAIATAHTLDDQAETVVLKFLRGAGSKGLAGIYPILELQRSETDAVLSNDDSPERTVDGVVQPTFLSSAEADSVSETNALDAGLKVRSTRTPPDCNVIRPLLRVSRQEVEDYLTALGQSWREDESNLDRRFQRNRVRHDLLPLLEREFNPNVRRALSDLAEIARGEEEFWQQQTARELKARFPEGAPAEDSTGAANDIASPDQLKLDRFVQLPLALQRRLLKSFAERQLLTLDFEHVERLRRCALGELSKTELPGGRIAVRVGGALCFRLPAVARERPSYQYVLPIPGEVSIPELNLTVRAELVPAEFAQKLMQSELLSLDLVGPELTLRNWQPGDRFRPARSGSAEKLKRLFAEKRIPAGDRGGWPVALNGAEILWVRGFPVANAFRWRGVGAAIRIEAISG